LNFNHTQNALLEHQQSFSFYKEKHGLFSQLQTERVLFILVFISAVTPRNHLFHFLRLSVVLALGGFL